ncbi:MAG: T9SS type A sorting domain-containing protein, partial [candidate division WOR-3 bacterium]|nr:T9SS type A sorting domain-containing protein [candidate division WOR-3 bacterium]
EFWRYSTGSELMSVTVNTTPTVMSELNSKLTAKLNVSPNPVSRVATVSYNVPHTGYVSVKLYDASGRVITTLYDGMLEAGSYTMTLDARNLAYGVYFLKYEHGTTKYETKLIVR